MKYEEMFMSYDLNEKWHETENVGLVDLTQPPPRDYVRLDRPGALVPPRTQRGFYSLFNCPSLSIAGNK